jgi:hypothetical protein
MVDNGGARQAGRRGLWIVAGIAAAGAAAAVVGIWNLPDRMYTDEAARAALQGGLLTAAAALVAVAGGLIALDETRQANAETRRANAAADARERAANENTHVRELYIAAIGLLGAETIDGRLGGIYALERVAVDSPADQRTVVEVLSAFIREHTSPVPVPVTRRPPPGRRWNGPSPRLGGAPRAQPVTDVQAALTVLGRLPVRDGTPRADLRGADLTGAVLERANLSGAWLNRANLTGALMRGAVLTDTWLVRVTFTRASMGGADLTRARLDGADLTDTRGMRQGQADVACGDGGTRLPAGLVRPASWGQERREA